MISGPDALHLQTWLEANIPEDEQEAVLVEILMFEADYPDIHLERDRTWHEVRDLAKRYAERPLYSQGR